MQEETYNKLRQFEAALKKCVIDRFKNSISPEKQSLLLGIDFIKTSNLSKVKSGFEVQSIILANMLDCIISFKCTKEFTLEDGTSITIPYGEDIENELIDFYSCDIAKKYKFGIDKVDKNSDIISKMINVYGDKFDEIILSKNAIDILGNENLTEYKKMYEENLLKPYQSVSIFGDGDIVIHPESVVNDAIPVENLNTNEANTEITTSNSNENKSILSEEEYQSLCIKYARNEEMTQQELTALLNATPELVTQNEEINLNVSPNVIEPEQQDVKFRGFALSSFSTYFIILTVILLFAFAIILL